MSFSRGKPRSAAAPSTKAIPLSLRSTGDFPHRCSWGPEPSRENAGSTFSWRTNHATVAGRCPSETVSVQVVLAASMAALTSR